MSNLLLRSLREAGVIQHQLVIPFARADNACRTATQHNEREPAEPWTVMLLDGAVNTGTYWVVHEEDALRLEAQGHVRYLVKPAA